MTGYDAALAAVRYIRGHDCDFLTIANVQDYSGGRASADDARAALVAEMGAEWVADMEGAPQARAWRVVFHRPAGAAEAVELRAATREFAAAEARRVFGDVHVSEVAYAPAYSRSASADHVPGQITVELDAREFAVIGGRRWTRVAEYLSNGQLTARFFVDEAAGEAREAAGWKSPKRWPMHGAGAAFVLSIVARARELEAAGP